ncbi:Hypothetical predicted protein [Olea europaea subsp. europaea]|uniref:Pentatricopeptide repeat-containing protein n=1 Tax=Olea europaea subsp. europaea TaxID=158383 RepID=A0A8S0THH3_OLEEU|nr:Hypothetical predicted protein [Olea europaea subsp. europaea]
MQEAGVQPDKAACNILVEICCRNGETWAMMKILQYMKENFLVLRYPVYQKALETFKMAGESCEILKQVNRHFVIEHFKEEKTDNFGETASGNRSNADNGLVLNLINKRNLVAVDYLLADMMDKGVPLDSKIISTIIELNSANGRRNNALFAFEYGMKFGLNIDRIAYIALIGLSIRTNSFSKVVEIVGEMVREGHSLGTQQSALLIYHLGCNRDPVSAAKIFSVLPEGEKNIATYTALIGAYFSSGNVNKGLETLQIMKSVGINVALGTYCVVVGGLEKCSRVSELEFYRKEKKRMQAESNFQAVSLEETICNFLFAGDSVVRLTR